MYVIIESRRWSNDIRHDTLIVAIPQQKREENAANNQAATALILRLRDTSFLIFIDPVMATVSQRSTVSHRDAVSLNQTWIKVSAGSQMDQY